MEIVADTIATAWEKSIIALLNDRLPIDFTQRGERAREILGLQFIITNPLAEPQIPNTYPFGELFIEKYCQNILGAAHGEHSINSRIIKRESIGGETNDQLQKVVDLLKDEPNSRRALICLWNADEDIKSVHPPCVCLIHFLIRNGFIDTIAYFRSNDSWMAALPDMIAITRLTRMVSDKLSIPVGKYIHFAASYHLYEPDIVPAQIAFGR